MRVQRAVRGDGAFGTWSVADIVDISICDFDNGLLDDVLVGENAELKSTDLLGNIADDLLLDWKVVSTSHGDTARGLLVTTRNSKQESILIYMLQMICNIDETSTCQF